MKGFNQSGVLLLVAIFLLITGCAQTKQLTSEGITPEGTTVGRHFNDTLSVSVSGGREKDPLGINEVPNETLQNAVKDTIVETKLFKQVVDKNPDYKLELFIVKVGQPVAGKDMTVNVEIAWALKMGSSEKVVWKRSIVTSAVKTREDESIAANRIMLATEAATKLNIEQGVEALSNI
ncbi:hypothetical protein A3193_10970 [Candidatus Thiodiazotropha endoloripes]|uniref:hypothetical protein n=1 Tax=Candidatus Thiodiazotropha endoloripes TaxID=1818881 RepID=UPI00083D7C53|nr:hypothetical protein [Candidatus Thiodiazotropha endoloripes]ODB83433.1 hypothetical protein A3193_10970 [Candidatus Thiodiazotropha endoloripes]